MNRPLSPPLSRRRVPQRVACLAVTLALALLTGGCEAKLTRLELDPAEGMKFYTKGKGGTISVAAYDADGKPFIRLPELEWSSSDDTVVTVDAKGTVTSTGSGTATVTASAGAVSASTEMKVMIIDKIEFDPKMPTDYKAAPETRLPIMIIVRDDKGNAMKEHRKVSYQSTSGCIEVYQEGTFTPYQKGDCSIVASVVGKEARLRLSIKK